MPPKGTKVVASNRRVRHDYDVLDTFEAGIVLVGSEVKSLRNAACQINESFARIVDGEMWLFHMTIPPYRFASAQGSHATDRDRKLLLKAKEIDEIAKRMQGETLALVPTAVYFKGGRAKVELAVARGRRKYDKRQAITKRDMAREAQRALRERQRG